MRYTVQFDRNLDRWVVVDTVVAELIGIHLKLAPARRQAEALENRWAMFKSFYLDMARATQPAALELAH